ncbi:MAG: Thioredoxin reductase [Candidatus Midichloria mitochondrii]|nr:thioredoxin-disulfide reductase [Candidatus Midichloria mitochondrii]MDJ1288686.1 thioredoxin-disulfide reductase [Candidatus Midichloria mitochondrii]MDJ1299505.1 thioredoxin-disulfide reductase [Candidatus Midichloria mitochondrii]MDJ1313598.1 thioredoxin-disulfide reductase [Candidatus Midichloria mitochondrii]
MHTKILIIGSGPAGYSAAIYAARSALKPILIAGQQPGGQLTITTDVENYPGFAEVIQGPWLMEQMKEQAKSVGVEIIDDYITDIDLKIRPFSAVGAGGTIYTAESVIISTGAQAKWLGLPSEEKFKGFGVSGCATCDGFFYKNKKVIVVGGGNSALEEALYLTQHAAEVILIHRRDTLRAEKISQDRLFNNPKIRVVRNTVIEEVLGAEDPLSVTGVRLRDILTGKEYTMDIDGVFVAIGHKPNTALFAGQLDLDEDMYIVTKKGTTLTSIPGVFAAGDAQDKIYRQAVTAAGTGCMAALDALKYLQE